MLTEIYSKALCSDNLESWEPSKHLLIDTRKSRKTCVEVPGRRTFRNCRSLSYDNDKKQCLCNGDCSVYCEVGIEYEYVCICVCELPASAVL